MIWRSSLLIRLCLNFRRWRCWRRCDSTPPELPRPGIVACLSKSTYGLYRIRLFSLDRFASGFNVREPEHRRMGTQVCRQQSEGATLGSIKRCRAFLPSWTRACSNQLRSSIETREGTPHPLGWGFVACRGEYS